MKFHRDVLAAHAQFGGDLEGMQRRYDATVGNAGEALAWQNIATISNPEAPAAPVVVTDAMVEIVAAKFMANQHGVDLLGYPDGTYKSGILYSMRMALEAALIAPAPTSAMDFYPPAVGDPLPMPIKESIGAVDGEVETLVERLHGELLLRCSHSPGKDAVRHALIAALKAKAVPAKKEGK
ncbi:hypothetical protein [Mesorhizobium sp. M0578]|uniref:hypothetical protein n=1 Tax=unclassified Mesorhizobium TaxID=325217 RepID=UPI003335ADBD